MMRKPRRRPPDRGRRCRRSRAAGSPRAAGSCRCARRTPRRRRCAGAARASRASRGRCGVGGARGWASVTPGRPVPPGGRGTCTFDPAPLPTLDLDLPDRRLGLDPVDRSRGRRRTPRRGGRRATATTTLGSPSGTAPTRCSAAAAHSPWRSIAAVDDPRDPLARHLGVGLVLEALDVARRPREGDDGAGARVAHRAATSASSDSGSARTRDVRPGRRAPPLTGGISASSSPARQHAARDGVVAVDREHAAARPPATSAARRARRRRGAPSGSSSSTSSRPARSRSIAKRRTRTVMQRNLRHLPSLADHPLRSRPRAPIVLA